MKKILIVQEERAFAEVIAYNLRREKYAVLTAHDGERGLLTAMQEHPDLVLLDLFLPGIDGIEMCRQLRERSNVPIIFVTAREAEVDVVLALEMGADDYVTKPLSIRELLARVKALLRRSVWGEVFYRQPVTLDGPTALRVGPLQIDPERHLAAWEDRPLELRPKEFALLYCLALNRNMVLRREFLLEHVWGHQVVIETRTVDVHMRILREKIEYKPSSPQYLLTVRGVGYRFQL